MDDLDWADVVVGTEEGVAAFGVVVKGEPRIGEPEWKSMGLSDKEVSLNITINDTRSLLLAMLRLGYVGERNIPTFIVPLRDKG